MQEEFDNLSDILKEWLGPPTTRSRVARAVSTAKPVDSIAATVAQLGTEIRVYLPLSLLQQVGSRAPGLGDVARGLVGNTQHYMCSPVVQQQL